jgi:hypothetical protein
VRDVHRVDVAGGDAEHVRRALEQRGERGARALVVRADADVGSLSCARIIVTASYSDA